MAQVLKGTWDEVSAQLTAHADEFRSYKRLTLVVVPEEEEKPNHVPNEKGLAIMREIAERQKSRPHTDGSSSLKLLHEARAGAMYGHDAGE